MDFSCPQNSSSAEDHHDLIKMAIQVLIDGRQLANQLLLPSGSTGKPSSDSGCYADDGSSAANDLLLKILGSFTQSISILNHATSGGSSQLHPNTPVLVSSPPSWDGRKSEEDSDESSKSTNSSLKKRRGCYKRRKTSHTWTKITPTLIDDGHAWRKYGQKVILNAKHPRNYFRCTHKFDQGCQATKQVQKTEEADGEPPMYRITYHGHHTCRNLLIKPSRQQIMLMQQDFSSITPTPPMDSPAVLLSFGSPNTSHKSRQQPSSFPTFPCSSLTKREHKDAKEPRSFNHHDQSAPSDFLLSPPDPILTTTAFEPSGPLTVLSSGSGSDHDHWDVISSSKIYSCTSSTQSSDHGFDVDLGMDMDMVLVGPDKFDDDVLQFEFE